MKRFFFFLLIVMMICCFTLPAVSDDVKKDKVQYKIKHKDEALKKIEDYNKEQKKKRDEITSKIQEKNKEREKKEKEERKIIRYDLSGIVKPESPEVFKSQFRFDPVPQYLTGTCWCFSATSMLESEIYRIHNIKLKLSEIYTVYWEYVEKARRFVQERGYSNFAEGSESDAVLRIWKMYGIIPAEAYIGIENELKMHDHSEMFDEMDSLLKWVKANDYWYEDQVLEHIKIILDKYLGKPPAEFVWQGKKYTPMKFLKEIVNLNLDDYMQFQSTVSLPFYTKGIFDVEDNWWRSDNYYNIPLDEFMSAIDSAISNGYTIAIGGDVSEPGYNGWEDIAVVPTFDIPAEYIDQDSREFRIASRTTEDDHGVHLVGYTKLDGHNWYLIKDSARSSRYGKFKGYYFYRDDYIKIKMLTIMVHKDAVVKELIAKIKKNEPAEKEFKFPPDGK